MVHKGHLVWEPRTAVYTICWYHLYHDYLTHPAAIPLVRILLHLVKTPVVKGPTNMESLVKGKRFILMKPLQHGPQRPPGGGTLYYWSFYRMLVSSIPGLSAPSSSDTTGEDNPNTL